MLRQDHKRSARLPRAGKALAVALMIVVCCSNLASPTTWWDGDTNSIGHPAGAGETRSGCR
jgi:hypothetical protein